MRYGIKQKTLAKWKERKTIADRANAAEFFNSLLGTRGSATDSTNYSRRLKAPWDTASRSSARIGLILRQPTASCLLTGQRSGHSCRPLPIDTWIVPPPLKASFLWCTIQPSLAINARSQKRPASTRA